jgi:hypothetical protein
MQSLKPANNLLAAIVAGAVAGGTQHLVVSYGIDITPATQNAITGAVMLGVAHAWDVVTGENVPPPAQGQAAPPPIPAPAAADAQPTKKE